jgi:hypothetical protein
LRKLFDGLVVTGIDVISSCRFGSGQSAEPLDRVDRKFIANFYHSILYNSILYNSMPDTGAHFHLDIADHGTAGDDRKKLKTSANTQNWHVTREQIFSPTKIRCFSEWVDLKKPFRFGLIRCQTTPIVISSNQEDPIENRGDLGRIKPWRD